MSDVPANPAPVRPAAPPPPAPPQAQRPAAPLPPPRAAAPPPPTAQRPTAPPPPPQSPRAQNAPPPPRPQDHPWGSIFHQGRAIHITATNWPHLLPYVMVPLQVMRIQTDRSSFSGALRGMLVAVEVNLARQMGLEPVLWLLLPDDDGDTTYEVDPDYNNGWERYTFLNSVARPNAVFTVWNNYYPLSQLCPTWVPPSRQAYSYVNATRTIASGIGLAWDTAVTGMLFGVGFGLAVADPFYDYYYGYPGLSFRPGYGWVDPTYYGLGLGGALIATEMAVAAGIGVAVGFELGAYALGWSDPYGYQGSGLLIVEPGAFVYGGGGLVFDNGYGGFVGNDGSSFAVVDYGGGFIPDAGYVDAGYVDNGYGLPAPDAAYAEFGGGDGTPSGYPDQFGTGAGGGVEYQDPAFGGGDVGQTGYQDPSLGVGGNGVQNGAFGGGDDDVVDAPDPFNGGAGGGVPGGDFPDDGQFGGGDNNG